MNPTPDPLEQQIDEILNDVEWRSDLRNEMVRKITQEEATTKLIDLMRQQRRDELGLLSVSLVKSMNGLDGKIVKYLGTRLSELNPPERGEK